MIPLPSMQGKTAAVLGLGRSGRSACRALRASGARVWAWDDAPARRAEAADLEVPLVDLALCAWDRVDRLVLSPGIPLHHPRPHAAVGRAQDAGVAVVGDVELLVENQPQRPIVGITGTNGKSTTTSLVGALLRDAGSGAQVGGNIGLPVLDLWPTPEQDIYVLELSSYQLDLTEHLSCRVAVILNLSADHLDRHGGLAGYVRAKRRILRNQKANDWAVIGVDDDHGQALFDELAAAGERRLLPVAVGRTLPHGVYVEGGQLYDALDQAARGIVDLRPIASLRGAHNWQNAAAAYGVARALGVAPASAAAGLRRFQGLAHRMEAVATLAGVQFVNDSKATNPEAAARALASFERIYWIAGGRPKESGLDPLLPWLDRVRHAFLIGEAAAAFAEALSARIPCTRSGDLASAVAQAAAAARADRDGRAVVLLSPACASFDQFADFEARGDAFKALVAALAAPASVRDRRTRRRGRGGRPMTPFSRTQRGLLGRWWWTVDRPLLAGFGLLAVSGLVFVFASSPPVALRLGLPSLHFVGRHMMYLLPAALLLLGASLLSPRGVHRLAVGLLLVTLVLLALTLLFGPETKGARRWLPIAGLVVQPSEFMKPALVVVVAGLLAQAQGLRNALPGLLLTALVLVLLLGQPAIGMALTVACLAALQLFLAGLPWLLVIGLGATGGLALWQAYVFFPHVSQRFDRFIDPTSGDHYQVGVALKAVQSAAWFGSGPGEGTVKYALPDAHSDFVFAVIAEEFGLVACLALIGLFTFVLLRGLRRTEVLGDRFALLAAAGLLGQFGIQAVVNLGVNLSLLPATGMTLPFISYGGSSLCALALGMGMFLALTRRRPGGEVAP